MPQFPFSQTHYFAHFIAARELETLQQHSKRGWDTHALHGSSKSQSAALAAVDSQPARQSPLNESWTIVLTFFTQVVIS